MPFQLRAPYEPRGDQPEAIAQLVDGVSCIYGLGTPEDWRGRRLDAAAGSRVSRRELLEKLVTIQYTRNDVEVGRGNFRVRGDVVEVHPAYDDLIVRIELDDDVV